MFGSRWTRERLGAAVLVSGVLAALAAAQPATTEEEDHSGAAAPSVSGLTASPLHPPRLARIESSQSQPQSSALCCPAGRAVAYADDYLENTVPVFFAWDWEPGWISLTTNCGTMVPSGTTANYHPAVGYWILADYIPCDSECKSDIHITADPARGSTLSYTDLCLEERPDLCMGDAIELCVCTFDEFGEDAPAAVAAVALFPADGTLSRTSGASEWDLDHRCYSFCTTYTAGEQRMDKTRIKIWMPANPENKMIYSVDQLGCCSDDDCDDGAFCSGVETCVDGTCVAGGDPCPGQLCCPETETCAECCGDMDCADNGVFCDGPEICIDGACVSQGDPCSGATPICCENSQSCAADCCVNTDCPDDGLYCDGLETCVGGECGSSGNPCGPAAPVCCENDDSCAADCCVDADCPGNGVFCDGAEICTGGACTSAGDPCPEETPVCCEELNDCAAECCGNDDCDDDNECTYDLCTLDMECLNVPQVAGFACGDDTDDDCTEPDSCDGEGNCLPNHLPDGTACSDGVFCTDGDSCERGACVGGPSPCTDPENKFCDEELGICRPGCLDNAECDDGNDCTGDVCNDNGDCLNPRLGAGTPCGDHGSTDCDAADTCDGAGNCLANLAADGTPCSDGLFCTSPDVCWNGVCQGGASPCTSPFRPICDEENDECRAGCLVDAECDDGNACTRDICLTSGDCDNPPRLVGTPCGDDTDDVCTNPDTCDGNGVCLPNHADDDTPCADDRFCNGEETCEDGVCVSPGSPCESGFACNETDHCHCDDDGDCDDGLFCNGAETCVDGSCQTPPPPCGDRLECDELDDACYCTSDGDCDDGLFCNGSESCEEGACVEGVPPDCSIASHWKAGFCDEEADACGDDYVCALVIAGPSEVGRGQRAVYAAMVEWDDGSPSGDVSERAEWAVLSGPESQTRSPLATISGDGVLTADVFGTTSDVWVQARVRDRAGVELVETRKVTLNAALGGGDREPAAGQPIGQPDCGICGALDGISAAIMLAGLVGLSGVGFRRWFVSPTRAR